MALKKLLFYSLSFIAVSFVALFAQTKVNFANKTIYYKDKVIVLMYHDLGTNRKAAPYRSTGFVNICRR